MCQNLAVTVLYLDVTVVYGWGPLSIGMPLCTSIRSFETSPSAATHAIRLHADRLPSQEGATSIVLRIPESQGQNVAMTVFYAPYLPDRSGTHKAVAVRFWGVGTFVDRNAALHKHSQLRDVPLRSNVQHLLER